MTSIAFIILALVAIFSALMVVTRSNPVASVLWLVLNFFALAGFYVLLGAQFLAAVQIIVYAGAIMVLFLFVVMMLNLNKLPNLERTHIIQKLIGALVSGVFLVLVSYAVRIADNPVYTPPTASTFAMGTAKTLGTVLFGQWMLPFQIVGFLLLSAMIGVVALAKMRKPGVDGGVEEEK